MEQNDKVKISLTTFICIAIIIVLLIVIVCMCVYYNFINISNTIQNDDNTIKNSVEESYNAKETAYEKYKDLHWIFKDGNLTEISLGDKKVILEDGVVYLEKENERKSIDSIKGKVKNISEWGIQDFSKIYALTEDGIIWEYSLGSEEIVFENVGIQGTVIDITKGNSPVSLNYAPYFLLSTGELVNQEGIKYDDIGNGFVKCFGNSMAQIFVSQDNTISYYDLENNNYIKIKDEDGNVVKIKDAFIQWSTIHNDLVNQNRWRR